MNKKRGLGRGLEALIQDESPPAPAPAAPPAGGRKVPVQSIRRNPLQPRRVFEDEPLRELAASLKAQGLLQPLLVRVAGEGYELIAGERRLRAAGLAGLTEVPVIVVEAADEASLEIALIENLQREDLSILEEAEGYRQLSVKFGQTQEQIAERMGKSRAAVANALRILTLPQSIRQFLADGSLSAGHAKVLLSVPVEPEQAILAERAVRESLSVRALEKLVERLQRAPKKPRAQRIDIPDSHARHLADAMQRHFGTSVRITPSTTLANGKKRKGCLEIDFHSNDELDRLLDLFGITDL